MGLRYKAYIHVYASTEDADKQAKDEFYTRLQDVIDDEIIMILL